MKKAKKILSDLLRWLYFKITEKDVCILKVVFTVRVYQGGKFDEDVKTDIHEFSSPQKLADTLVAFVAQNSFMKYDQQIMSTRLEYEKIKVPDLINGSNAGTILIIKSVEIQKPKIFG